MLAFERRVVGALTQAPDAAGRAAVEEWVDEVLADMPEPLRLGVVAETVLFGTASRLLRMDPAAVLDRLERAPIGLLRQYPRLFRSLVLFGDLELR